MKHDPAIHHRRSIRLKGYDYTQPGAYFVTLVTYHRDEIFGKIMDGAVILSPLGKIVYEEWRQSAEIRKEIFLCEDEFVVMPNYVHGIVWIIDLDAAPSEMGASLAPLPNAGHSVGANGIRPMDGDNPSKPGARRAPQQRSPKSLGSFIAGFKASVTSRARRELDMTGIWQRNYYDHIIRREKDFQAIWNYIDNNPRNWESDQLHPSAASNPFNQE